MAQARGHLFPFVPVLIGCGVGAWFALPSDPPVPVLAAVAMACLVAAALALRGSETVQPLSLAACCLAAGFLAAETRATLVDAPRLEFRYYGPVQGRILAIDRSQSDRTRLTLDRVVLADTLPSRTPARVRVSLHGAAEGHVALDPGQVVILTGHLAAPEGPVEPGGFDFRRMAWFDRLGAVGYTRTPVLLWQEAAPDEARVTRLRAAIRRAVEARIPGDPGAFAAALMTGDRAGISPAALQSLRDSNLAHLLAISGLHMGLLAAFVFAAVRYGLALVPPLALRVPGKKVAALVALGAGGFYLVLSGGNVATERAYVMVAVMLTAVLFDRRALSLRSVAMAATVILLAQPETLTEPGFQMSFAATVVLIAGFGAMAAQGVTRRLPRWVAPLAMLVASSALAGLATAPVAAAHFNRMADYGLLANTLAVPVMGLMVMPAAVAAAVLSPVGGEGLALAAMELGTRWILGVAAWVAGLEGAVTTIPAPAPAVLPLMALGALWVILWPGWPRLLGLASMVIGIGLWAIVERPALLISADGALSGVMTDGGRALSTDRGAGFAARQWLENDGDPATPARAAARMAYSGPPAARSVWLGDWRVVHLKGKGAVDAFPAACAGADLVIIAARMPAPNGPCRVIDLALLSATGALALHLDPTGALRMIPSNTGQRRWSKRHTPPPPPAPLMRIGG
ncbi:MAG: ComEC/Rec2 family competence protein [Gemmobacter sp.]